MTTFGNRVDGITGRRRASRRATLIAVSVETLAGYLRAELINISETGAKLRGRQMPPVGGDVLLKLGGNEVFGCVVWAAPGLCGVQFDEVIEEALLKEMKAEAVSALANHLTPEERQILDDWESGHAR